MAILTPPYLGPKPLIQWPRISQFSIMVEGFMLRYYNIDFSPPPPTLVGVKNKNFKHFGLFCIVGPAHKVIHFKI